MTDAEAIDVCEDYVLGVVSSSDGRLWDAVRVVLDELRSEREVTSREWTQRDEALRRIDSLEAKLEQSEHNCDMLLRYIDQALRDARQLKASLDDWAVSEADADAHRLRSTRAYQIVKGLEVALGPPPSSGV